MGARSMAPDRQVDSHAIRPPNPGAHTEIS
jgi:hypothetical protein